MIITKRKFSKSKAIPRKVKCAPYNIRKIDYKNCVTRTWTNAKYSTAYIVVAYGIRNEAYRWLKYYNYCCFKYHYLTITSTVGQFAWMLNNQIVSWLWGNNFESTSLASRFRKKLLVTELPRSTTTELLVRDLSMSVRNKTTTTVTRL